MIQCGAILAIVWEYRARLTSVVARLPTDPQARRFATNLLIAFLPVAILGLLFGKAIKEVLFKPVPVAVAFIVGGLIILWAERRKHEITVGSVDEMTWSDALKIGLAQTLALDTGHLARRGYHHRRIVFWPFAPRRHGVFFFSGYSGVVCRIGL